MYSGVQAEMVRMIYTKVEPEVCKKNRTFYKNHVRKAFVMFCAYEGYFDGVLSKSEIEKAKKGQLPKDLNIHHKMPLSGTYDGDFVNSFDNLVVIHKKTHERINKDIFQPQLNPIMTAPFGTQISIEAPAYGYVDAMGIRLERSKMLFKKERER